MKPQEKLVLFMKEKAKCFPVKVRKKYFCKKDGIDILSWADEDAENTVENLKKTTVYLLKGLWVGANEMCPYCIRFLDEDDDPEKCCPGCHYKQVHRCCFREGSDYNVLFDEQNFSFQDHIKDNLSSFMKILGMED